MSRIIKTALSPLLNSSTIFQASVVDYSEQHIVLASGEILKIDSGLSVGGKPFLFEQLREVRISDQITLYFGFEDN